jgi:hypothetical protein
MVNQSRILMAAAVAASFAATSAHATSITLNPDSWQLFTEASAGSDNNPPVPNTGPVDNTVTNLTGGSTGSQQDTVGASGKATMSIGFAPAGLQGQATATASNVQTNAPTFDNTSGSANFSGGLQVMFAVVGPAIPGFPLATVPVDIQGAMQALSGATALANSHASASIDLGGSTLSVSSFQGSTNNSSLSFNVLVQVFLNNPSFIFMSMDGLASSSSGGGTAGGTISASAEIDPFFYIDPSFADLYPGIDLSQYSIVMNSEFLNIPEGATTALPAALPLFATGLGALGLFGWRRKRKVIATA